MASISAAVRTEVRNDSGSGKFARIELGSDERYLINPGSVGQPRDNDWRAAFAVL